MIQDPESSDRRTEPNRPNHRETKDCGKHEAQFESAEINEDSSLVRLGPFPLDLWPITGDNTTGVVQNT